jgi:hypothetical protein
VNHTLYTLVKLAEESNEKERSKEAAK